MSLVTIKRIAPSPNKKGKVGSRIVPQYKSNSTGSPTRTIRCIFENLPVEIVVRIVSYLGVADICRLSRANRFFSSFCKSDIVWRGLFKQRWGPKIPTTTLELPEVQKKMKELTSNLLATKTSPNAKKKIMPKPSWKEAYKARVFKTCSMCNVVVEGDSLAAWMGFRFCKKCQRERFITKKLGLAMFDIKPKDFEQLRYFEIMLGASGRLQHPVRLYYIDDIQGIVEAREENQKLKHKKKKQKKGGSFIDESGQPQQATNGGISATEQKKLSQEEEKTKQLEEKLIKNQVQPFR